MPKLNEYGLMNAALKLNIIEGRPKKFLKVLAFDPGLVNIAIAFLDREFNTDFTTHVEVPDALGFPEMRFRYMEHVVEHWVSMFRPDIIFKEGVTHSSTHGLADSGRFQYIIERIAMDYGIPFFTVATTSMRSFLGCATKGNTKADIKLQVYKKFNKKEFPTQDECDAYAIGETGIAIFEGRYVVNKSGR